MVLIRSLVCVLLLSGCVARATAAQPPGAARGEFVPGPACASLGRELVPYSSEGLSSGAKAQPNTLSPGENPGEWRLLFDGKSLSGWAGFQSPSIPAAWHVEDGALTLRKLESGESTEGRSDLRTTETVGDFELRLQWAISPAGNSGIFYFVREGVADRVWMTAPEFQVLDDPRHEDGLTVLHRAGALYDLYPPQCNALRPAGEYNDLRIVVRHGQVEHWLNGYRVVRYELDSPDFRSRLGRSKFHEYSQFARVHTGYLALQDHGDAVRFRSIRLRKLQ